MEGYCKHCDETSGTIEVRNFLISSVNINFLKNSLHCAIKLVIVFLDYQQQHKNCTSPLNPSTTSRVERSQFSLRCTFLVLDYTVKYSSMIMKPSLSLRDTIVRIHSSNIRNR